VCSHCQIKKRWRKTDTDFPDDGFGIVISGVPAWVCPQCGDTSFTPDVTDMLIHTFRELSSAVKGACLRKPKVKELVVRVA
jgi:RNA polymerase subunit RPABC4/transcription elongation factor Spt4